MALPLFLRRHFATKPIPSLYPNPPSPDLSISPTIATLQLLSWGRGASGQLGDPLERDLRPYPSSIASLSLPSLNSFLLSPTPGRLPLSPPIVTQTGEERAVEVGFSCGLFHSAIVVDNKVWIWGKGDGGRLGFGDEISRFVPSLNPNLKSIVTVALGGIHSAALSLSGEVFTCFQVLRWIWSSGSFCVSQRAYWDGNIAHLATSGAHTAAVTDSGIAEHISTGADIIMRRFRSFNIQIEELYQKQCQWIVHDPELRESLRLAVAEVLLPAYRSFIKRFGPLVVNSKAPQKYIKYSPEDLEKMFGEFFEGKAAGEVRR